MGVLEAIILGIVQGLTEFIPVSSSGHLVLLHDMLGVTGGGLIFDVALHLGTLFALVLFFFGDIVKLLRGLFTGTGERRLALMLMLATVPAAIAGFFLQGLAETNFRSTRLAALNLIIFGLLMLAAEYYSKRQKQKTELDKVRPRQAVLMGVAQAIAIIPGVSRSGITITGGLFGGLDRVSATRFAFLLAIPITVGATLKVLLSEASFVQIGAQTGVFVAGITAAFLSGLFAIGFLIRYLSRHSLAVFAYYRLGLGALILLLFSS